MAEVHILMETESEELQHHTTRNEYIYAMVFLVQAFHRLSDKEDVDTYIHLHVGLFIVAATCLCHVLLGRSNHADDCRHLSHAKGEIDDNCQ